MKNVYLEKISNSYHQICDWIFENIPSDTSATATLDAESSLFVRFNNHRIRQNTQVEQGTAKILLSRKQKSYRLNVSLTGQPEDDLQKIKVVILKSLAEWDKLLSEEIDLILPQNQVSSSILWGEFNPEGILNTVIKSTTQLDFTGIMALGPVLTLTRNSKGARHEFLTEFISIDYSLYDGPRAAKGLYSSRHWSEQEFVDSLTHTRTLLESMRKTRIDLKPDVYRAYLAPGAIDEITGLFQWGALSQRAYKTGRSSLKRLIENDVTLSPLITMAENFELGLGPQFNSLGEKSPSHLPLVQNGQLKNLLTSSKSALEFGVESNQSNDEETFRSLSIDTGTLKRDQILTTLNTGIFISNLHYLNWSNPNDARITGMTRYACFWVENGQIQGPIADLRFDDSIYSLWGSELESITQFSDLVPNTSTYYQRQLGGKRIPGMIVKKLKFTH